MNYQEDYDKVFGESFKQYEKEGLNEMVSNLEQRFKVNDIDAEVIFKNKKCLDAGCGNGPASLYMAKNGAKEVDSIDISTQNVNSTAINANKFDFESIINPVVGSVMNLPYPDQTFDVVWCYGVVHHTESPDQALKELYRVLKTSGKLILFLYGTGGILWYIVNRSREFTNQIETDVCRSVLELSGLNNLNMLTSIMDNWKVPFLCTYTHKEVSERFNELGLEKSNPWKFGLDWDTNHRISLLKGDDKWMGEGDLRYIVTKKEHKSKVTDKYALHNNEVNPNKFIDKYIISKFSHLYDELNMISKKNFVLGLLAHKQIFLKTAELLRSKKRFNIDELENKILEVLNWMRTSIK